MKEMIRNGYVLRKIGIFRGAKDGGVIDKT
jgi:hypothetical protein